jgi:uncharacterized protein
VGPRLIYVDTSFWIAASIDVDAHHPLASELVRRYSQTPLATSNLVVGETWTFVNRRFGHRVALALLDRIEGTPRLQTVRVDADMEHSAWTWLRSRAEREYSFVDATSFAVMRRLALRETLAFDGDFTAAGFVELRA